MRVLLFYLSLALVIVAWYFIGTKYLGWFPRKKKGEADIWANKKNQEVDKHLNKLRGRIK